MMKIFNILGSLALLVAMTTACAVNDPFADNMDIGQVVPTVSWELSDVAKAGGYVSFKAKYYTNSEHSIDHCEVWGLVTRSTSAAATYTFMLLFVTLLLNVLPVHGKDTTPVLPFSPIAPSR